MINYSISDNGSEVTLTIHSISQDLMDRLVEEATVQYELSKPPYSLILNYSGINKLESNFGSTVLYVSYNGFEEQTIQLIGYTKQDRDSYSSRVNLIMEQANNG